MRYDFLYEEHPEYGGYGIRPLWLEGAQPARALQAAHDIMEHFNEPITSDTELQALGAMLYVRAEGGYFNNRYSWSGGDNPGIILEGDLTFVAENQWEYGEISNPGNTRPLDEQIESWIIKGIASSIETLKEDYDFSVKDNPNHARYLQGWLRKGYRRARARYPNHNPFGLAHAFRMLEEDLKEALTKCELNYMVRVNLVRTRLSYDTTSVEVIPPWDSRHPDLWGCLRPLR